MQPWQDPELEAIRAEHRAFAREHLDGDWQARDHAGGYTRDRWLRCAEQGLLGICMPSELGGQGRPVSHAVAAFEGLGEGCRDGGFVYAIISQVFGIQMSLTLLAPDPLKNKYLPGVIRGETVLAHAFTEETAGSDAYSMETTAETTDGGWRLNGRKTFITNAPEADMALVFARTGAGRSPFALSAFLVDLTWPGCRKDREFEKLGLRTIRMGELVFDDVHVPSSHVLGRAGMGLRVLTESTGWERAVLLTSALGPMARTLDEVVDRAKTRRQFGKPIGSYQQVSAKVADMVWRYRLSRMVVYDMASRLDRDGSTQPHLQDVAIAKLFVSEQYVPFMLDAVQLFGVRGYLMDWPYQQDLRDSISSTIYAGTSETLRNTIAKLEGLPVE